MFLWKYVWNLKMFFGKYVWNLKMLRFGRTPGRYGLARKRTALGRTRSDATSIQGRARKRMRSILST